MVKPGLCKAQKEPNSESQQQCDKKHQRVIQFFRNLYFAVDPFGNLHRGKDHKDQHHNAENQCQNNIQHRLYPIKTVDKIYLILAFQRESCQRGAIIV